MESLQKIKVSMLAQYKAGVKIFRKWETGMLISSAGGSFVNNLYNNVKWRSPKSASTTEIVSRLFEDWSTSWIVSFHSFSLFRFPFDPDYPLVIDWLEDLVASVCSPDYPIKSNPIFKKDKFPWNIVLIYIYLRKKLSNYIID